MPYHKLHCDRTLVDCIIPITFGKSTLAVCRSRTPVAAAGVLPYGPPRSLDHMSAIGHLERKLHWDDDCDIKDEFAGAGTWLDFGLTMRYRPASCAVEWRWTNLFRAIHVATRTTRKSNSRCQCSGIWWAASLSSSHCMFPLSSSVSSRFVGNVSVFLQNVVPGALYYLSDFEIKG